MLNQKLLVLSFCHSAGLIVFLAFTTIHLKPLLTHGLLLCPAAVIVSRMTRADTLSSCTAGPNKNCVDRDADGPRGSCTGAVSCHRVLIHKIVAPARRATFYREASITVPGGR